MTAHLRMNAVYWGLTALCIMKHKEALDAEETIEYVMSCWDDEAGAHESPNTISSHPSLPRAKPPLTSRLEKKRSFWRAPGPRRAHPIHAKRHPSPSDARSPPAHERATHSRLYAASLYIYMPFDLRMDGDVCSHTGPATVLGRLRRRRLWRDGHALSLLRRLRAVPPRRTRPPRPRAHRLLSRLVPQL